MFTWVIGWRGSDGNEHQLAANADDTLTEQKAAMIVSNFIRLQALTQADAEDQKNSIKQQYNFQITSISRENGGA